MLVTVLLGVVFPACCVVACGFIGRHYERRCIEHRLFCEDIEGHAYALATSIQHDHAAQDAPTEVLPRIRLPDDTSSTDDPPLLTHGHTLYARASGRHRLADKQPHNTITLDPESVQ